MNRTSSFQRHTQETKISLSLNLDGSGQGTIETGIGFLNHMLNLFQFHGNFDLDLHCDGDLEVCAHHSVEDIALSLGEAFKQALGDPKGITRYASFYLPMDETLTRTVVDISGRPWHHFNGQLGTPAVGQFPTEMTKHFFTSFAQKAGITLHQDVLHGENDHHIIESLFKGLARALKEAITIVGDQIPSTKGVI